ncbi:DUF1349 domain-containing protein [Brevibacillus choshinensis]|uniref:DUF1349 domain-containing protein n=1 Tax=Brevibacillus choshinensis TaxID=54911 RepID=UPI002E1D0704|nr:DUF1349 domain-containing protein [Brevibacillus choshinensis]MED4750391.1 DUF1349 domain-containing protein [Brevibacillus choshinensis]MED4780992.1 DUF1349 domain-containing protein [Brevibacillus choshinensis]
MNLFEEEMHWMNEPDNWRMLPNHALEVSASPAADFFRDPQGDLVVSSAPFFYTEATGNFILTARVSVEMKSQYDSGCLMVMVDRENWAKLCFELYEKKPSIMSVVTQGVSDDAVSVHVGTSEVYLRIAKFDSSFAFHYSVDGEEWNLTRYFGMKCLDEVKVGCVVQSPTGEGCTAIFDYLDLKPNDRPDVRQVL